MTHCNETSIFQSHYMEGVISYNLRIPQHCYITKISANIIITEKNSNLHWASALHFHVVLHQVGLLHFISRYIYLKHNTNKNNYIVWTLSDCLVIWMPTCYQWLASCSISLKTNACIATLWRQGREKYPLTPESSVIKSTFKNCTHYCQLAKTAGCPLLS